MTDLVVYSGVQSVVDLGCRDLARLFVDRASLPELYPECFAGALWLVLDPAAAAANRTANLPLSRQLGVVAGTGFIVRGRNGTVRSVRTAATGPRHVQVRSLFPSARAPLQPAVLDRLRRALAYNYARGRLLSFAHSPVVPAAQDPHYVSLGPPPTPVQPDAMDGERFASSRAPISTLPQLVRALAAPV